MKIALLYTCMWVITQGFAGDGTGVEMTTYCCNNG
jgi:hypothetical protein